MLQVAALTPNNALYLLALFLADDLSGAKDDGTSVAASVVNTSDPTAQFMAILFCACFPKFMSFDVFFILPVDIVRWCRFCTCTFPSTNLLPAHICPLLL
jgi:hypothetical protein